MKHNYLYLIWLFCLLMVANVNAQYQLTINDVEFDETTGTITAYKWPEHAGASIKIPDNFNGISVKIIGEVSFYNLNHSTEPTSGLTEVEIPESVVQINQSAFQHNQISSLKLKEGLIAIKKDAFSNNILTKVNFPNSVSLIDTCSFRDNNLIDITFPEDLRTIYLGAFQGNSLNKLTLPQSLERIEQDAFCGNNISELNLPVSLTYLNGFRENSFTQITIPSHVKEIGWHAFSYNPTTNLTIQDGVKKIGRYAFSTTLGVHYEPNSLKSGQANDYSLEGTIEIPSSVKEIDNYAFEKNGALTQVIFNNGIESIGINAFAACGFTSVEIPVTVKIIKDGAFGGNQITSLTLQDGLEKLEQEAFAQNQLTYITIPGTVKRIGSKAFYGNTTMDEIIINEGTEVIGSECFSYNQSISTVSLPKSLLQIEEKAFFNSYFATTSLPVTEKQGKVFSHWATYLNNIDNTIAEVTGISGGNEDYGYIAIFKDTPTSITSDKKHQLVYTNPVKNIFSVNTTGVLEIYNLHGSKVFESNINSNVPVNLSHLSQGMYVFVVDNSTKARFIKQ